MKVVGVHHGLGCDQKEMLMCKSLCCDQFHGVHTPRMSYFLTLIGFFIYIHYNILYFYNFNNTSISLLHLSLCAVPPKQTKYHSRLLIVGIKDIHTYILNTSSCHTITEEHKIIDISTYLGIFFTIQLNFYLKYFFLVLKYQPFIVIF